MTSLSRLQIWFVTGSQHLYGEEILEQVQQHASAIARSLHSHRLIPVSVVEKPVVKTPEEIYDVCRQASADPNCVGIIAWMHTFSPAKMWIRGLSSLAKPLLHLHTQFNRDIPWSEIDMNFMNLNQSAHGDREFGYISTRIGLRRKVVVGHWQDQEVLQQIDTWARAAAGWHDWQAAKFVRFGDNMRQVAVTEGDKVEAEMKFGYSVNTHGVGDLVASIRDVAADAIDALCDEYNFRYQISKDLQRSGARHQSLRDAAAIELGLLQFLKSGDFKGFTDTFEDLHGMVQLPGIASQRVMAAGYGFGGEGDWKTAALVRAMKVMATGLDGGNSFMEDYTYHFEPGREMVLGAHMLEICETIANGQPKCEIHPLGIGGKADPVRLVFNSGAGSALNASIVDLGGRFRMIVNEVQAVDPPFDLPKLPVARVLWKPLPDMKTACAAWILAGGAHHTCYSQNLTISHLEDFADIAGIEFTHIGADTSIRNIRNELKWNEAYYQINR